MSYEAVSNPILILDAMAHLNHELHNNRRLFRVAVESHQILHRTMVQALRGSNNLNITGRRPKRWEVRYQYSNDPWKYITEQAIENCNKAWRFTEPQICDPVVSSHNVPTPIERLLDQHLLGFYDFLAMVQTECYMSRLTISKPINISDEEMQILEWLHEDVRNAIEHFVPSSRLIETESMIEAIHLCIRYSVQLICESGTILLLDEENCIKQDMPKLQIEIEKELPWPQRTS